MDRGTYVAHVEEHMHRVTRRRLILMSTIVSAVGAAAVLGLMPIHQDEPSPKVTPEQGVSSASEAAGADPLETLTVFGHVPDFTLTERSGRALRLRDLRGRVWVANFIFTACVESCPLQSEQIARLQAEFATEPNFRAVSFTVDPAHDTPRVLARYARRYQADPARWLFVTGPKRLLFALARDGFKLAVVDADDDSDTAEGRWSLFRLLVPRDAYATHGSSGFIMHSPHVVLVDGEARIRAYHRPADPGSLARLRTNLRTLLGERPFPHASAAD